MKFVLKILIFVLFVVSFTNAQELSRSQKIEELRSVSSQVELIEGQLESLRSRQEEMMEDILSINSQDKNEAERIGAKAVRLFPDGVLDLPNTDENSVSVYSFTEIARYYFAPRIEYKRDKLTIVKENSIIAFVANIGGTLPETISEQTREVIALAKYEPPENPKDAEKEITIDNSTFGKSVPVIVGNTYILRGISYRNGDGIVVFKIHRKDSDGSIILFIKKIRDFPMKETRSLENKDRTIPVIEDYAAQQAVQNALIQKGFYYITVEATTAEVTLRGTVPKGKLGEMMQTAMEAAKRKINNQVTEKNY